MRRIIAAILALTALMGLAAVFSPAALADGDPASDVLAYDSVFNPPNSGATQLQYDQLVALVKYVSAHGYPIKVALINSASDLGTVTQLWKDYNDYAIYLGKEASGYFTGTLLVAMPDGYGLRAPTAQASAGDERWGRGSITAPGAQLIQGTYLQVERLAADNGVSVPSDLHVQSASASAGSIGLIPLIGLIAGALAVLGAWAVSLRIRPLHRRAVPA